jgi:hypothetical protein
MNENGTESKIGIVADLYPWKLSDRMGIGGVGRRVTAFCPCYGSGYVYLCS